MTMRRFVQVALIAGVALFMMAVSASASTISYSTTGAFITGGTAANSTLVFTGNAGASSGIPSIINLGDFESTATASTTYAPFTFDIYINDTTDGATGYIQGSGSGAVTPTTSNITITWGSLVTQTGSFGFTTFSAFSPTPLGAPNSGSPAGDTTVQGYLNSSAVPEPATLSLIGGALLGLGILGRKKFFRQ